MPALIKGRTVAITGRVSFFKRLGETLFYRDGVNILSVLQVSDFRNLWLGQLISFVGDALAYNTLTFAIIRMADDAGVSAGKLLSALFVLSAIPALVLGMIAGTIVDRSNRKKVMIIADIIRGFLALGFLFATDINHIWVLILVSIALSIVSTFFYPARTALLPQMLDKEQLLAANALAQLTHTLSFVVGAAAAGFLVGWADATAPSFVIDSITFFVSAYFIARISISGTVHSRDTTAPVKPVLASNIQVVRRKLRAITQDLVIGLRYVFTDQLMRGVLISFLALMLGLGAANVTFIPLLVNELQMPEEGLGLVRFSQTLGIIAGSAAVTASFISRRRARDIIGGSMLAFGVMTMVAVLFVVGLVISPPQIVASTIMQRHVPGEKLGRASGAQGTIVNVANIASMGAAGLLMDEIGARRVFTLAGTLIFLAGIVSWWVLRSVSDTLSTAPTSEVVPKVAHSGEQS